MQIDSLKYILKGLKYLFTPLALIFLGYYFWQSREILTGIIGAAQIQFIILSILMWVMLHVIAPFFTITILSGYNISLCYKDAFCIHAGRLPAKYLPGGIWHSVARAVDYHNKQIPPTYIASYFVIENVVAACVSLAVGGLIVSTFINIGSSWKSIAMVSTFTGVIVLLVLPSILDKYKDSGGKISLGYYYSGVLYLFGYWAIASLAFVFYLSAFPEISIDVSWIQVVGIYLFSWGIGFVALFAPQGIGVTEFVMAQLIETDITAGGFAALLAGFRVVIILGDLLAWGLSRTLYISGHKH